MACEGKARRMLKSEELIRANAQAALIPSDGCARNDVKEPIECVRWPMAKEEVRDGFSYADDLV